MFIMYSNVHLNCLHFCVSCGHLTIDYPVCAEIVVSGGMSMPQVIAPRGITSPTKQAVTSI